MLRNAAARTLQSRLSSACERAREHHGTSHRQHNKRVQAVNTVAVAAAAAAAAATTAACTATAAASRRSRPSQMAANLLSCTRATATRRRCGATTPCHVPVLLRVPFCVCPCCARCCSLQPRMRTACAAPGACRAQLPYTSVRPPVEEAGGYSGVAAPKRKRVEEEPLVDDAPPKVRERESRLRARACGVPCVVVCYAMRMRALCRRVMAILRAVQHASLTLAPV